MADRWLQRSVPGARLEPVGVEAVLHDQQALAVPEQPLGLVADRRGEPDGPRADGGLDADLGPAARVGVRPGELAEVRQRPAGLGQGEHGRGLAAARPAQAARRPPGNEMTAWRGSAGTTPSGAGVLRRRARLGRAPGPRAAGRGSRSSQIGATCALDSIRSVPGRDREHGGRGAGRGPDDREAAEVRVHDDPDRPREAERRDAADGVARQLPAPRSRWRAGPRARRSRPPGGRGPRGWDPRRGTGSAPAPRRRRARRRPAT